MESTLHSRKVSLESPGATSRMSEKYTFRSKVDIFGIPAPTTKPAIEVWHETQFGFGVRIGKARKDGVIRRTYISRVPRLQPDGTFKDDKPALGLVEDIGTGDAALSYKDAELEAMRLVRDAKLLKGGGTVRMTMGQAYEKLEANLASSQSTDSPAYGDKLRRVYERFLAHLSKRYLDELKEGFWIDFLGQVRDGTLDVGAQTGEDGTEERILRKAGSANYSLGILNAASRLYKIAHEYRGIEGEDKEWDPTRAAVKKIEEPNARETYLQLKDVAKAWQATDQLMPPWWRDLWRVYLLTGLRDKLVMDMRFDQIDFERGLYLIQPLQTGTKRRRKKLSQADRLKPIEMPLSSHVLAILRRRKQFAPEGPAGEWVWYSLETERRKTKDVPRLTDPRASWKRLVPVVGYWVYKHDLRRTFASLGATIDPGAVLALSLLLLHSSKGIASALGIPQITVEYIKGQQDAMRALTEKISRAVLELAGDAPQSALTAHMREFAALPGAVDQALRLEDKAPERGQDVLEEETA
ncbi:hypothetical protein D3C71_328770 [compost metagenome]